MTDESHRSFTIRVKKELYVELASRAQHEEKFINTVCNELLETGLRAEEAIEMLQRERLIVELTDNPELQEMLRNER